MNAVGGGMDDEGMEVSGTFGNPFEVEGVVLNSKAQMGTFKPPITLHANQRVSFLSKMYSFISPFLPEIIQ